MTIVFQQIGPPDYIAAPQLYIYINIPLPALRAYGAAYGATIISPLRGFYSDNVTV